jgi:hypothetical protein
MLTTDFSVPMSDDVDIAVRVYLPGDGKATSPTLFAVSPYRFDNDGLPKTHQFLWYEMGPYEWYVEKHGYAFVRMDVRGTGRSGGQWRFLDQRERLDLYEVVEWVADQPWSTGKIGGIGQSYYATSQWALAAVKPPHLTCLAPYDGTNDPCAYVAHSGGIPSTGFTYAWWNDSLRPANERPFSGPSRKLPYDFPYEVEQHPARDEYWRERTFLNELGNCDIPVYAVGAWSKLDLHTNGVIDGFQRVGGIKKLRLTASPDALTEFSSEAFHEEVLLPFYDWALKGKPTGWTERPVVEFDVLRSQKVLAAEQWPPAESEIRDLYLAPGPTGSVTSLNDGRLASDPSVPTGQTSYSYPDEQWTLGPIVMGPDGIDRAKRVLTFTTEVLDDDLTLAGPGELVVHLESTRHETDVIVKLAEQLPQPDEDRKAGRQPDSVIVTKGWLRSGHRDREPVPFGSGIEMNPELMPLTPGEITELRVPLMAVAHRFSAGSRIRLEVCNADSKLTDRQFYHPYAPDKAGTDTLHHGPNHPSRLRLTVLPQQD